MAQRNWYTAEIAAAASKWGLDPALVEAVCWQESSCKTNAYRFEPLFWQRYLALKPEWNGLNPDRWSASYGLMQIMAVDARELGFSGQPEELFQPAVGLDWACKKLANLVEWAKGNIEQALAAYNGGKGGNVTKPFRNGVYAAQVLARQKFLQASAKKDPNAN